MGINLFSEILSVASYPAPERRNFRKSFWENIRGTISKDAQDPTVEKSLF